MDAAEIEIAKERLLSKVEKTDSCWLWTACKNKKGYGQIVLRKKHWLAHRLSYTVFKGGIPDGMFVCHSCDNPSCLNPDHLWVGSSLDNQRDSHSKGRTSYAKNGPQHQRRSHCRIGHDYLVTGIYEQVKSDGRVSRSCMECRKVSEKNRASRRDYQREYQRSYYYRDRSGSGGSMDRATDF